MRTALLALALCLCPAAPAQPAAPAADPITLELIMSDPDWIGPSPQRPYWADDGKSFYYTVKRIGSEDTDLVQVGLDGVQMRVVPDEDKGKADVSAGDWSPDYTRKVYSRNGDLFLRDVRTGVITQITRTVEGDSAPRYLADGARIFYRRGSATLIRDLATGVEEQPADLRAEDDPDEKENKDKKEGDYLKEQQGRLFDFLKEKEEEVKAANAREKAEREADPTRPPRPFYFGSDMDIREASLSPDGRRMLVRLAKKGDRDGKRDTMPQYVTESGYVEIRGVRSKVGTGKPLGESLVLIDLVTRERKDVDLSVLPRIADDPFQKDEEKDKDDPAATDGIATKGGDTAAEPTADATTGQPVVPSVDSAAPRASEQKEEGTPKPRPVSVNTILWTDDGSRLAIQAFSLDNKDRWIGTIDLGSGVLTPLEHDHDPAWINGRFVRAGWLRDGSGLWFLSERDGYSNLFVRSVTGAEISTRALVAGPFEVSGPSLSRDGRHLYYTASPDRPTTREYYRVEVGSGSVEQLTRMGGVNDFDLSPDESHVLITHSTTTRPPELFVQALGAAPAPVQASRTVSERFTSLPWVEPRLVQVPTRHGGVIHSRLYALPAAADGLRPAVLFVHGAGYLQNAHEGWSQYFREFMFHTLLARRGYVVLDMDYRASSGYGRDWRTAIYSRMGTPELEDLEDGVKWLAANHAVDPARVGVYGGSYGGFLTLMALFTKPDLFACGAALRPVTDWAHYNDGYTANILDTPSVNPEAFARSSPIEFAAGLSKPLLICHGMQDDNVFFQDTVRLAQRLIELGKENWEVAAYPVEPHSFERPSSWLDEYRRILKLFETHLK